MMIATASSEAVSVSIRNERGTRVRIPELVLAYRPTSYSEFGLNVIAFGVSWDLMRLLRGETKEHEGANGKTRTLSGRCSRRRYAGGASAVASTANLAGRTRHSFDYHFEGWSPAHFRRSRLHRIQIVNGVVSVHRDTNSPLATR